MNLHSDTNRSEDAQIEDRRLAALVAQLLHPIDVQVLEALAWIGMPLSECDLVEVFGGEIPTPSIRFRVRRLLKLNAIEVLGTPVGLSSREIPYRLAELSGQELDGS